MRAGRSVDELAAQTLAERIPPASDAELAPALQTDSGAMSQLSADALWAIAGSVVNADKLALYDLLIERQNTGLLTPDGKQLLSQLREEADALMLRKAQAYALFAPTGTHAAKPGRPSRRPVIVRSALSPMFQRQFPEDAGYRCGGCLLDEQLTGISLSNERVVRVPRLQELRL